MRLFLVAVVVCDLACGSAAYERAQGALYRLKQNLQQELVSPQCDAEQIAGRCGMLSQTQEWDAERYRDYSLGCVAANNCGAAVQQMFGYLSARYPRANGAESVSCVSKACEDGVACNTWFVLELCMLQSHNNAATAEFNSQAAIIQANYDDEAQSEADQKRRRVRAVAAGMQAFGAAMAATPRSSYAPRSPGGCTSDYACGYGQKCVKGVGQIAGFCAQAVDRIGVPTYAPPSLNSVGTGQAQCWSAAQCAIGFQCVSNHCVK